MVLPFQDNYLTLNKGTCFDLCIAKPRSRQALSVLLVSTNYSCLKVDGDVKCMGNFGANH